MPTPPKIQPPTPKPVYVVYVPIFGGGKSGKYAKETYLPKTYSKFLQLINDFVLQLGYVSANIICTLSFDSQNLNISLQRPSQSLLRVQRPTARQLDTTTIGL